MTVTNMAHAAHKKCTNPCGGERDVVRCNSHKEAGGQCSRRTSRTDECWQHLRKNESLWIKGSEVPGAGKGLFAWKDGKTFHDGDKVADYTGEKMTKDEIEAACPGDRNVDYGLQMSANKFMNACKSTDAAGRFINSPRGTGRTPNCRFAINHRNDTVTVKATRTVRPGQEFLIGYGRQFRFNDGV